VRLWGDVGIIISAGQILPGVWTLGKMTEGGKNTGPKSAMFVRYVYIDLHVYKCTSSKKVISSPYHHHRNYHH
jgi:hypothetical protein